MMPKTDAAVAKILSDLASGLGTTAEHLWRVLIVQARVSAWTDLAMYSVVLVCFSIWLRNWFKIDWSKPDYHEEEWKGTAFAITGSVILIGLCVSLLSVGDTITKFANPEYWALQSVLKSVGR